MQIFVIKLIKNTTKYNKIKQQNRTNIRILQITRKKNNKRRINNK